MFCHLSPRQQETLTSLLFAAHADLDDEAPRLVLADWLEEHDDPRAELVRLSLAASRLRYDDPRARQLREEQQAWAEKLRWPCPSPLPQRIHVGFWRGLLTVGFSTLVDP